MNVINSFMYSCQDFFASVTANGIPLNSRYSVATALNVNLVSLYNAQRAELLSGIVI